MNMYCYLRSTLSSFEIDTDISQSYSKWNWTSRSTRFCCCITKQWCETLIIFLFHISIYILYVIQTLTTLNLGNNQIGDAGAQFILHALQTNKVNYLVYFTFIILICLLIYRHYRHWILDIIELDLQQQQILLMH
jgi:hypothetical protein